ncbi:MAG TPA: hypothetical protein VGL56_04365 [Fimbriimonadaceae bacterium]
MNDAETYSNHKMPDEYGSHATFGELDKAFQFYDILSSSVFGFISRTRLLLGNLDSYFFDALAGTVESTKSVLLTGRIADAYTLLRRFRETTHLQVYIMLRFQEDNVFEDILKPEMKDIDFEEFSAMLEQALKKGIYVEEVEKWLSGQESLPPSRIFSQVIVEAPGLQELNQLFDRDLYNQISERCNDHVHINFFRNLRVNVATSDYQFHIRLLEQFRQDFKDLLIKHIAYVFYLKPEYMMSSDHMDYLECGMTPPEDSEYWVSPVVQEVFDSVITPRFPAITDFIKKNTAMHLG